MRSDVRKTKALVCVIDSLMTLSICLFVPYLSLQEWLLSHGLPEVQLMKNPPANDRSTARDVVQLESWKFDMKNGKLTWGFHSSGESHCGQEEPCRLQDHEGAKSEIQLKWLTSSSSVLAYLVRQSEYVKLRIQRFTGLVLSSVWSFNS